MNAFKNFNSTVLAVVLACAGVSSVHAELVATPLPGDARLVEFPFSEDNTYLILTKPKALTHLQFAPDEIVSTTAAGDTAQWQIDVTKNRKNIFIKPKYEGVETSLTVLTDKRSYQFVLKAKADGLKWYQRVSWQYQNPIVLELESPTESMATNEPLAKSVASGVAGVQASGIEPKNLKFGYEISGDAPFRPTQVFDDGKFTWLRMPADVQELPALFTVVEDQQYALVNYTVDGDYIIAQRLLSEAVLKLGKKEVHVVKKKPRTFLGFKVTETD